MTLADRRAQLADRLQDARSAHQRAQYAVAQLASQIDQLLGAVTVLDQLIAEEGEANGSGSITGAEEFHGHEVRPSEAIEERQGEHGRLHDDGKAAP